MNQKSKFYVFQKPTLYVRTIKLLHIGLHSHAWMLTAAELQQLRSMRCSWMAKAYDCRSECCEF